MARVFTGVLHVRGAGCAAVLLYAGGAEGRLKAALAGTCPFPACSQGRSSSANAQGAGRCSLAVEFCRVLSCNVKARAALSCLILSCFCLSST